MHGNAMNLRTMAFETGDEGLAIDHRDGSMTIVLERPDQVISVHLSRAEVQRFESFGRRADYQRAGRASAAAKRRRVERSTAPVPAPVGGADRVL